MADAVASATAAGGSTFGEINEVSMDVTDLELPDDSAMMTDSMHAHLE